jgi:hypothetical protein
MIRLPNCGGCLRRPGSRSRLRSDVTNPGLTYIGLDSQGKADLTRVISSSILQRLSVYAAQRTIGLVGKDAPRFLIVDEANWVNRTITQNLLSRARGAGISMWLCAQGPKDWIDKTGDDWGKLTQNINVAIIMRQGEPESAELCADFLGKEVKTKTSERVAQVNSMLGQRRVKNDGKVVNEYQVQTELDYRVPIDALRELTVGEAVVRVSAPQQRLEYTRILMRDPSATPMRRSGGGLTPPR